MKKGIKYIVQKPIELLSVIVAVAVVITILLPSYSNLVLKTEINSMVRDCKTINKAISEYYSVKNIWPGTNDLYPIYLSAVPKNLDLDSDNKGAYTFCDGKNNLMSAAVDSKGNIIILKGASTAQIVDIVAANAIGKSIGESKVVFNSLDN